jgi:hypothetical protein
VMSLPTSMLFVVTLPVADMSKSFSRCSWTGLVALSSVRPVMESLLCLRKRLP